MCVTDKVFRFSYICNQYGEYALDEVFDKEIIGRDTVLPEPVMSQYASKNRTLSTGSRIKLEKPNIDTVLDVVMTV